MQIHKISLCAMFSALLCVCAWIAVPLGDISVTMQTFGVFLALVLLGGKHGSISVFVYLLLGAVGLPVFSGFRGGLGVLLGTSGGYIWGFGVSALLYWLITAIFGTGAKVRIISSLIGMLTCYLFGSLWYLRIYLDTSSLSFTMVLLKCVVPYVIPDAVKLLLAHTLANKLRKFL